MKKNIKILGTMMALILILGYADVRATAQQNINTTLSSTTVKSVTVGIGTQSYPALYTSSEDYGTYFAIQSSAGTTKYYSADIGSTYTVSALGSLNGNVVILKLKNKTSHLLNRYSGIISY